MAWRPHWSLTRDFRGTHGPQIGSRDRLHLPAGPRVSLVGLGHCLPLGCRSDSLWRGRASVRPRQGTEPSQLPTGREALTADAPGRGRRSGWAEAGDPGGGPSALKSGGPWSLHSALWPCAQVTLETRNVAGHHTTARKLKCFCHYSLCFKDHDRIKNETFFPHLR